MKAAGQIFGIILIGVIIFAAFWLVEVPALRVLLRQYDAESFLKTEGQILSAEVVTHTSSKGRIYYHPSFIYTYAVAGRHYTGQRYRYDGYPSEESSVEQIVYACPPGFKIDVYYDPNNPAETVLSPRVVTKDVRSVFLFSPIILMSLVVLFKTCREVTWPGNPEPMAGGMHILSDITTTRVRLPRYPAGFFGLLTTGVLLLISGILFEAVEFNSPLRAALAALFIVFAGSAIIYGWQYQKIASGQYDLIINCVHRTIELPLTYQRQKRRPLPFSSISRVVLEKVAHNSKSGVRYTYAPTFQFQDGASERLVDLSQKRAEAFAAWLREKLGLPA